MWKTKIGKLINGKKDNSDDEISSSLKELDVLLFIDSNIINYSVQNSDHTGYINIRGKLLKDGEIVPVKIQTPHDGGKIYMGMTFDNYTYTFKKE